MNNNSTLFFEYTVNGKIEINKLSQLSFDFDSYNDVYKKLNDFNPLISDAVVDFILEMANK
jgi:hypothetical protein